MYLSNTRSTSLKSMLIKELCINAHRNEYFKSKVEVEQFLNSYKFKWKKGPKYMNKLVNEFRHTDCE